ncbi:MAG: PEP-CTERM sorting domain-containing protein [Candidatus Omnitrophota bacterium]|nr:PEP-CTERM sorting domain-containing protein [Candidatus Omnitrophota bacterium]
MKKTWLVIGLVSIPLLTVGCGGGGGGLSSLFGGGDSGAGDVFSAVVSGGSDIAGGASDGGATETLTSSAATVHSPEPASVALFGGGLAGLACLRRRKAQRSKPTKR